MSKPTAIDGSARYHHRRPFDRERYDRVREALSGGLPTDVTALRVEGQVVDVDAGDALTLSLIEGPQIVHLAAWNRTDPDERVWTNETSSKEDCFLIVDHRLWGTMARFRPLLTMVEDTVHTSGGMDETYGRHHPVLAGWETAATWALDGGDPRVTSVWDRMLGLRAGRGADPTLHRDHVSLFQKLSVDPESQRLRLLPSDGVTGDRVVLFAEIDLSVALVPSPYRGGGIRPADLDGSVRTVGFTVRPTGVEPPGWPYAGVPYPDLSPYIGAHGRRVL